MKEDDIGNEIYPPFPTYYTDSKPSKLPQTYIEMFAMCKKVREEAQETAVRSRQLIYQSKSLRLRGKMLASRTDYSTVAPVLKTCSCGREFSPVAWTTLPFVQYTTVEHLDAELRNCICGSTITLIIERRECNGT